VSGGRVSLSGGGERVRKERVHVPAVTPAVILLLGLLLLLPAASAAADASDLLLQGETGPAFAGLTLEGKPFILEEELTGGAVFLVFWSIF